MQEYWREAGFGIYFHWPFCEAKCPYCDFNSYVAAHIDQDRWAHAYLNEIDRLAAETGDRLLKSVYFGGGTPSLMDPALVSAMIERVKVHWQSANDIEITLEANPGSVEIDRFRAYSEAGVNRISLGIQALNDTDLKRLGRLHNAREARAAFDVAKNCFDRVSFDLIYARQEQSLTSWRRELSEALSMAVDHLSLYQLTIEPGTAFGARHAAGGLRGLPDDDLSADMYLETQDICAGAGMFAYEVSNHARNGSEGRHNLIYWRGGDYAGIGPGAHGRMTLKGQRLATTTSISPIGWLEQVEKSGHGEATREVIDASEQALEYLLMSLRLTEGADLGRYEALAGHGLDQAALAELQEDGLVFISKDRLSVCAKGRPILNAILRKLL